MLKKQLIKLVQIFIKPKTNNQTIIDNKISFREATLSDKEYIFNSILREAKAGHFNQAYLNNKAYQGTQYQILSTIKNRIIPTLRGNDNAILNVLVYSNQLIGFSWIKTFNENKENGWEVYLMTIESNWRKQKFGKILFDATLKILESQSKVFVRVYQKPHNIAMNKLLKQYKFKQISTNAKDTYLYKRLS